MAYGVVPSLVRHRLRHHSSTTVFVLAALLLASVIINTQRAHQHIVVGRVHDAWEHAIHHPGSSSPTTPGTKAAATPATAAAAGANRSSSISTDARSGSSSILLEPPLSPRAAVDHAAAFNATGSIPRILHQNYMGGPQQLLADALRPLSHFRKEWWRSCQTHHPGWVHMLWDAAACEQLLHQHYPWFLDTWRALGNSTVLKSDAIRPFILHAHGGVYLDLDSECFADMSPWLQGAQLVMQAEMASVARHPLWTRFMRGIQSRVAAGKRWPLETTGPHLLTDIVRKLIGNAKADLPGAYTLADGSKIAVYGPKQWFTPCAWNDWTCAVNLARDRPLLRSAAQAAVAAAKAKAAASRAAASAAVAAAGALTASSGLTNTTSTAASASAPQAAAAIPAAASAAARGFPDMMGVEGVAGVHHFSGSWLGLDGSKSLSLRKEGVSGVLSFLYGGKGFVQQPCKQLVLLPHATPTGSQPAPTTQPLASSVGAAAAGHAGSNTSASAASFPAVPVCWDAVSRAAAAGNCTVLSVRATPPGYCGSGSGATGSCQQTGSGSSAEHHHQQQHLCRLSQWLGPELALAGAGCQVKLVSNTAVDLTQLAAALSATDTQQPWQVPVTAAAAHDTTSRDSRSLDRKELLGRISSVTAVLGVAPDPFAEPPVHTLDSLLRAELPHNTRLTLLLLDPTEIQLADTQSAPGSSNSTLRDSTKCQLGSTGSSTRSSSALDILNQLYISSSASLRQVDSLVVMLRSGAAGQPPTESATGSAHKAFAAYQHLFQESGFVGFHHSSVSRTDGVGSAGVAQPSTVVLGLTRFVPSAA